MQCERGSRLNLMPQLSRPCRPSLIRKSPLRYKRYASRGVVYSTVHTVSATIARKR